MRAEELRKKYPEFIYKGYAYEIKKGAPGGKAGDLHISFEFEVPPGITFFPKIIVKNVSQEQLRRVGELAMNNLVFHLGLAEMPSYWKTTASPQIIVEAGSLNKAQINWWHDLFLKGMGEYFYKNNIDFIKPNFLTIRARLIRARLIRARLIRARLIRARLSIAQQRILVPIGGGKDAVVTYEILKSSLRQAQGKQKITPFVLNPKPEQKALLRKMNKSAIVVERTIDPKLLELNRKGYLNGHTPFSSYLAFLTVFCAALFGYRYIALSNERSSNEGNVAHLGYIINHQYSKSFAFEKAFRAYNKKYLAQGIEYFSFLRPLYELQIAKLFSRYPKYFATFLSCNDAHKTHSDQKIPSGKWCGACAKCLFVFTSLYPFVDTKQLESIFGKNLFADSSLIPLMEELVSLPAEASAKTGERNSKPFECVGTTQESLGAFYLASKKTHPPLPPLLKHFRQRIAKKHLELHKEAREILSSWNTHHFLPPHLEKILRTRVA